MTNAETSPAKTFSRVLLEKLTTPGVIFNALGQYPTEHIFFAVAGIAFGRWLDENRFSETQDNVQYFFQRLTPVKGHALRVIQTQAGLLESSEQIH